MLKLKCKRCGREWDYKGKKKYYCSCPDCRTSVKIKIFGEQHYDTESPNS